MKDNKELLEKVLREKVLGKRSASGKIYGESDIQAFLNLKWEEKEGYLEKYSYSIANKKNSTNHKIRLQRENKLTIVSPEAQCDLELIFCLQTYLHPIQCRISSGSHEKKSITVVTIALKLTDLQDFLEEEPPVLNTLDELHMSLCVNREMKQYAGVIYFSDLLKNHQYQSSLSQQCSIELFRFEAFSKLLEQIISSNIFFISKEQSVKSYFDPLLNFHRFEILKLEQAISQLENQPQRLSEHYNIIVEMNSTHTSDLNLISMMEYDLNLSESYFINGFCRQKWMDQIHEKIKYCHSLQTFAPNSSYLNSRSKFLTLFKNVCQQNTVEAYLEFFTFIEKNPIDKQKERRHRQGAHAKEIPICALPLAELYLELGQLEEAEIKYNNIPKTPFIWARLGEIAFRQKSMSKAKNYFLKAIETSIQRFLTLEDWTHCHYRLGIIYHHEENYEEAVKAYIESGMPLVFLIPGDAARLFCALLSSNQTKDLSLILCQQYILKQSLLDFNEAEKMMEILGSASFSGLKQLYVQILEQYVQLNPELLNTQPGKEGLLHLCETLLKYPIQNNTIYHHIAWALNQLDMDEQLARCFIKLGQTYFALNLYESAFDYYDRALKKFSYLIYDLDIVLGLLPIIGKMENPIGDFYQNLLISSIQKNQILENCLEILGNQSKHAILFEKLAITLIKNIKSESSLDNALITFCAEISYKPFPLSDKVMRKLVAALIQAIECHHWDFQLLSFKKKQNLMHFCNTVETKDFYNPTHHFNLCQLYLKLGITLKAVQTFTTILQLDPNYPILLPNAPSSFYQGILPFIKKKEDKWSCYQKLVRYGAPKDQNISVLYFDFLKISFELGKFPEKTTLINTLIYFIKQHQTAQLLQFIEVQDKRNFRHCNMLKDNLANVLVEQGGFEKLQLALPIYLGLIEKILSRKKKSSLYFQALLTFSQLCQSKLKDSDKREEMINKSYLDILTKAKASPRLLFDFTKFYKKKIDQIDFSFELCLEFIEILHTQYSSLKLFWVDEALKIATSKNLDIPLLQLHSLMKYLLKFDLLDKALLLCFENLMLNEPSSEINQIYQQLIEHFFLLSKKGHLPFNEDDLNTFQKICEMHLAYIQENKNTENFELLWKIFQLFPSLSAQVFWNKSNVHLLFDENLLQTEPYQSIFHFIKRGYLHPSAELFFQLAVWHLEEEKTSIMYFDLMMELFQSHISHPNVILKFIIQQFTLYPELKFSEFLKFLLDEKKFDELITSFWIILKQDPLLYKECLPYLPLSTRNIVDFHKTLIQFLCSYDQCEEAIAYVEHSIEPNGHDYFQIFLALLIELEKEDEIIQTKALNLLLEKLKAIDLNSMSLKKLDDLFQKAITFLPNNSEKMLPFQCGLLIIKMRLHLIHQNQNDAIQIFCQVIEQNKDYPELLEQLKQFALYPDICIKLTKALLKHDVWGQEAINILLEHLNKESSTPFKQSIREIKKLLTDVKETKNTTECKEEETNKNKNNSITFFQTPILTPSNNEEGTKNEQHQIPSIQPIVIKSLEENHPEKEFWQKGRDAYHERNYEKAISYFNKVLTHHFPRYHARTLYYKGLCYAKLYNHSEEFKCYVTALQWHGKTNVCSLDEAQLRHIKDWMETHPEAIWRKALWSYEKRNYTEAIDYFNVVLRSSLMVYYAFSNFHMGSCWLALGDTVRAIACFKEAEKYHATQGVCPLNSNQLQIVQMWTACQSFNPYQSNQNFYYRNNNAYIFYSRIIPNNQTINNNNQTVSEENQNFKQFDIWKGF